MTADLVAFLRARLDEDEQVARGADTSPEMVTGIPRSYADAPVAIHIARHDPARVLAEVDAKRRIIAEHEPSWSSGEPEYDHHHEKAVNESGRTRYIEVRDNDPVPPYWCSCCQSSAPCLTLRLLALPFDDHPDYQPEWAPEV